MREGPRFLLITLVAVLTSLAAVQARPGTITVYNTTSEAIYIVLDGRNQGEIWANSYECYQAPTGEHKVEAYLKGRYAYQYVRLSATYPDNEVTFSLNDF